MTIQTPSWGKWQLRAAAVLIFLLGAAAGALALLVVEVGNGVLVRRAQAHGGINFDLAVDARVFAFAAALSLLTAVLLGLVPAVRATRVEWCRATARRAS